MLRTAGFAEIESEDQTTEYRTTLGRLDAGAGQTRRSRAGSRERRRLRRSCRASYQGPWWDRFGTPFVLRSMYWATRRGWTPEIGVGNIS